MNQPPELIPFSGDWPTYEDTLYEVYLETVIRPGLSFQGFPIRAQFRPETRSKGFSFWHLISEAPDKNNRNEDDRIPDFERCKRLRWVAWCIENAGSARFSWWENKRGTETRVVIWAEEHDFAVVLAKRDSKDGVRYYLLKTAYCLKPHRRDGFAKERDAFWRGRND